MQMSWLLTMQMSWLLTMQMSWLQTQQMSWLQTSMRLAKTMVPNIMPAQEQWDMHIQRLGSMSHLLGGAARICAKAQFISSRVPAQQVNCHGSLVTIQEIVTIQELCYYTRTLLEALPQHLKPCPNI